MRITRPDILPIELWDASIGGRPLQAWRDHPAFSGRVANVVTTLISDPPIGLSATARTAARQISHVHLLGGAVTDALVGALALPSTRSTDPFAAARAGATLAARADLGRQTGARAGACADIGQTAIKVVHGDRAWRVERDLVRAPMREPTSPAARARARTSTIAFLGEVLASIGARHVVVGLPCELDAGGHPRGCTYCWPDPDPALIGELARHAGCELDVLNDAELAAHAALPYLPPDATSLVLTIGFAVGAAIVVRDASTAP